MRVWLIVPAALLAASPAFAQSDQVRRGPVPAWVVPSDPAPVPKDASGAVFMRRQDVMVHIDPRGQSQYVGYRVKILQSSALELGNLSFAWNPASGSPMVHAVTIYRDGQAIDVLKSTKFEILRREDQLEAAHLDGTLTAMLRIADLRVGDELEVAATTPVSDPTLGTSAAGLLVLGSSPALGRYRLALDWDQGSKPNVRATPDMTSALHASDRAMTWTFDDPATVNPPKDAPPRYQWQRAIQYSSYADWPAVSRQFSTFYDQAAKVPAASPVKAEADRIAAAHARPLDRAAAALKLVQQDVRYIYVGLNGGNLRPAAAAETWQRRYGDCKGKTALLLALLGAMGIDAEAVLVNSTGFDDGFDLRLPSPQLFDHVLVRATIEGKAYWLDGTLPAVAPPATTPLLPFRWVLPLRTAGATLERLDWRPPTRPDELTLYEIDAHAGFDTPARITMTSIVRGVKGLQQQAQFASATKAQLLTSFQREATGDTWQAIDTVDWRYDVAAAASVLTISGTGTVDWEKDGGEARSLALPGGGFSPPERRVRAPGENADAPFYSSPDYTCHVTSVRLPATAAATHWTSKPSYDTKMFGRAYHRAFELRDGTIRMVRGSRIEQPEIDGAAARRDNARIAAFDNSMGWISYDPSTTKTAVGAGEKVPATFDMDWTADAVPCLAAGKGS